MTDSFEQPNIRWEWVPVGYSAQGTRQAIVGPQAAQFVADSLINRIFPPEVFYKRELTDLKGREPNTTVLSNSYPIKKPELFFLAGEFRTTSDKDTEEEWAEFTIAIYTEFKEFLGPQHIVHTVYEQRSGHHPAELKLRELCSSPRVKVKYVRFGYELFESRFVSIFGNTPTVVKTLLIECNESNIAISAELDGIRNKDKLKLRYGEFIKTPLEIFNQAIVRDNDLTVN